MADQSHAERAADLLQLHTGREAAAQAHALLAIAEALQQQQPAPAEPASPRDWPRSTLAVLRGQVLALRRAGLGSTSKHANAAYDTALASVLTIIDRQLQAGHG